MSARTRRGVTLALLAASALISPFVASAQQPASSESAESASRVVVEAHAPAYLRPALTAGMVGRVEVRVSVSASGLVQLAELVHGVNPLLDKPASEAARLWRFAPGQAASSVLLTFEFLLAKEASVVFRPPFAIVVSGVRILLETPRVS
jgi:TonB family protein